MPFAGFPPEALTFYAGLEADNTKAYWQAHRDVYEDAVREPLEVLLEELRDEFGTANVFRPYRNLRFSKDKTPYKTAQGAILAKDGHHAGHRYIELSASGLRLGAGRYHPERDELERTRRAIVDREHGAELEAIKQQLERDGFEYMPPELKTAPRGYPKDHPRIDLLRRKRHATVIKLDPGPWLHTEEAKQRVQDLWRQTTPLLDWLERHAGEPA
jgi:uncharacterized protein (TIGR02453 family)